MGEYIRKTFAVNLAENAEITADRDDGYHLIENVLVNSYDAYYKPFDGDNAVTITVKLDGIQNITHAVIKEHIPMSQRVESFVIEAKTPDGSFREIYSGTSIGYQKIAKFEAVSTDEVQIRITDSRVCPVLSFIGIY